MKGHSIGMVNPLMKKLMLLIIMLLLLSGLVTYNARGWFNTPVREGILTWTDGEISIDVARLGGSTEYGYDAPATDPDPPFYIGLIANGRDNVEGTLIDFYPYRLKISINGTDPNGNLLSVERFDFISILVTPKDDGAMQTVLGIIYDVLVGTLPWPLNVLTQYGKVGEGGASIGHDGAYNKWAEWQAPPNTRVRDKGLRYGFELVVDPTLEGTYRINIHYHAQIFLDFLGLPGHAGYIDVYDTVSYSYYIYTPPPCCVAEGTLITMTDGTSKPIEKVKKGDQVLGFWPTNGSYMAENVLDIVKGKFEVMVNINNGMLKITPTDHPIFIRNSTYEGWMRDPANIQVGWEIYNATSNGWVPVTSITFEEGKTPGYDLVLDGYETYIANGILVMDKNGC